MNLSATVPSAGGGRHDTPHTPSDLSAQIGTAVDLVQPLSSELQINEALPGLDLNESTALLLDVNNLYLKARRANFKIDYRRLHSIFKTRCDLRYCGAFSAVDRENEESVKWSQQMTRMGYTVTSKDLYRYVTSEGDQVTKGNMDIELTLAAVRLSPRFDHVIIGSCDGDFLPLIEDLKYDRFRKVSVLGLRFHDFTGMSEPLVKAADNFYNLAQIRDHIAYRRSVSR